MFYFGDHLIHPSTSDLIPHPSIPLTHTHTHTHSSPLSEATLCANPFVFTAPFPPNNVLKPNPKPSSTNLGYLLTSHSAAKRPTETLTKPSV